MRSGLGDGYKPPGLFLWSECNDKERCNSTTRKNCYIYGIEWRKYV